MATRGYQQVLGSATAVTNASSSTWVDQCTATFNLDASSTYLVIGYMEGQVNNTTATDGQYRLFDGTTALTSSNARHVSSDASEWIGVNLCAIITTTSAATPVLAMQAKLASASSGRLVSTRNGAIFALKLTANDASMTNDLSGTSSANPGSFTDYTPASGTSTLTFTPATTGDYLIVAFAETQYSSAADGARVCLLCEDASTRVIDCYWVPANSATKQSWAGIVKRTGLTATSQVFKIQHSRQRSATGTSTVEQVRMVALRLSDFDSSNVTSDTTSRTTTSSTYVDLGTTQSDTLTNAIDYLFLGSYWEGTNNNAILHSAKMTDGTTAYNESQRKENFHAAEPNWGQAILVPRKVTGTGASVTHKLQGKITSVLTLTSTEHRLAMLQVQASSTTPTTTISAPSGTTAVATGIKVAVGSCLAGVGATARAEGHKVALYAASGATAKASGTKTAMASTLAAAGATAKATGTKTATAGSALAAQGATARAGGFKAVAYVGATARATGAKIAIGSDKAAVGLGILNAGRKLASASTSASVGIGVQAGGYKSIANLGVSARAQGSKVGLASLTGTVGVSARAAGLKVGLAALSAATGASAHSVGLKVGVSSLRSAIGLGVRAGGYKLTGSLGTTANALGLKVGLGSVNASAGVTAWVLKTGAVATSLRAATGGVTARASGSRVALAALRASAGATMAATGSRTTQGAALAAVGVSTATTARKLVSGALSAPVGATARPGGFKVVGMVVVAQVGVSTVAGGVKVATSPILGSVGAGVSLTGRKTATASARTTHGATARAFSSGGVSFGELRAHLGVTARATGRKQTNAGLYCSLGLGVTIGVAPFQPSMEVQAVLTSGARTTAVLVGPAVANLGPSDAHATLRE